EPPVALPDGNIGGGGGYVDIRNEIGIISTPVISLAHNAIYVLTFSKSGNTYAHYLHALELTTGHELFGGPRLVTATVAGNGAGSNNGQIPFTSNLQNQR